ncbi:hypothetical protein J6590_106689, partial [Homalodisca vitripennis]
MRTLERPGLGKISICKSSRMFLLLIFQSWLLDVSTTGETFGLWKQPVSGSVVLSEALGAQ